MMLNTSTAGTIATPWRPQSAIGRVILAQAIEHGPEIDRVWLAGSLRHLRRVESKFAAQHCLAWLGWIGGYPVKVGAA